MPVIRRVRTSFQQQNMLKTEGFHLWLLFCFSDVECDDSVILLEDENEGYSLASATPELGHSRSSVHVFSSQLGAPGSSGSIGPSSEGRESQIRVIQSQRFQFSRSGDYDISSQPTQSRLSGTLSSHLDCQEHLSLAHLEHYLLHLDHLTCHQRMSTNYFQCSPVGFLWNRSRCYLGTLGIALMIASTACWVAQHLKRFWGWLTHIACPIQWSRFLLTRMICGLICLPCTRIVQMIS